MMLTLSPTRGDKGSCSWLLTISPRHVSLQSDNLGRFVSCIQIWLKTITRVHCPRFSQLVVLGSEQNPCYASSYIVQAMAQTIWHKSPPQILFTPPLLIGNRARQTVRTISLLLLLSLLKQKKTHFISVFFAFEAP